MYFIFYYKDCSINNGSFINKSCTIPLVDIPVVLVSSYIYHSKIKQTNGHYRWEIYLIGLVTIEIYLIGLVIIEIVLHKYNVGTKLIP